MAEPDAEKTALLEFLGYQRDALVEKIDGVSEAEARSTPTASALSLLSIVKHSAIWEQRWFQVIVAGKTSPDQWPQVRPPDSTATFRLDDDETIRSVVAHYRAEIEASNAVLLASDLDGPCAFAELRERSVRWVALHLIEETARHAGHADIIRETIDHHRST